MSRKRHTKCQRPGQSSAGKEHTRAVAGSRAKLGGNQQQPERAEDRQLLGGILGCAMDAIILVDEHRRILLFNTAAERVFGCAGSQVMHRPIWVLFPRKVHKALETCLRKAGQGMRAPAVQGEPKRLEGRRGDGTIFPAEATFAFIGAAGGAQIILMVRDISRRTLAESRVNHLAAIVEHSNDAIYSRTLDGCVTSWNAAAERMFRYSAEEMIGRSSHVLEPKHRAGEFKVLVQKVRRGEMVRHFATERQRKDGRLIHVSLTVSPIRDSAGGLVGVSTIARDITQQVETEAALRQHEQELENLFQHAPVGLLWVSGRGIIQRLNSAAQDLLQCLEDEGCGKSLGHFFVYRELFDKLLAQLEAGKPMRNIQTRLRGQQGATRTVLIDAIGVWEGGRLLHTCWFVLDITARKQLEREVLAISERERQRLARELHDGVGQHLSGAAYLADSLREQLAEQRLTETEAARRLTRVIEESIQLTRDVAHGLLPVRPEPEGLITALSDLAKRTGKMFGIRCNFTCRKAVLVEDQTTATHLYRIAQEAVHNAIRHGKAPWINVRLSKTKRRLILAVRDNGLGISDNAPARNGMGLHIMRYRAGLIHGSLLIQRRPRGGTAVICSLDLQNTQPVVTSATARQLNELIG